MSDFEFTHLAKWCLDSGEGEEGFNRILDFLHGMGDAEVAALIARGWPTVAMLAGRVL